MATSIARQLCAGSLGFGLCIAGVTGNADDINQDEVLELRRSGAVVPFQAILQSVNSRYPGAQILEVELEEDGGHYIYEIDIVVADGSVRELEINAGDGHIVEDELED
ncbi:MAG: PepSY domain-containing protein [Halioglobus sp.]|nr:PepSY domain-containing protein [Halioglobus sp.]